MKVFFKKLKNCSKVARFFYFVGLIGYITSFVFLTMNVLKLTGIETGIRIGALVFFGIIGLLYLILGLVFMFKRKKKGFVIFTVIIMILIPIFSVGAYYLNETLSKLNYTKDTVLYSTVLLTLEDTEFNEDSTIGMIDDTEDIEGNILANTIIENENLDNEIVDFDDYHKMLRELYDGTIDAIFLSGNYIVLFSGEAEYENIEKDTKVVFEYSEERENKDLSLGNVDKELTEPFTILLLGVDSEKDGLNANQAFNGDTLMLITFNPQTLNATIFSIPRDTYVPITCRNGAYAKINSSAAYGTSCVIDTIQNLTGVPIDYYVKINFKGVVDLVEALGGVDVNVPVSFCEQDSNRNIEQAYNPQTGYLVTTGPICLEEGDQHLNGEEALAFARHRKSYAQADIIRIQNQQQVVEALSKKAKDIRSLSDFQNILTAVQKNIDTNMSTDRILSFYDVGKDILNKQLQGEDDFITIERTYLEYGNLNIPGYAAIGYYTDSLAAIVEAMKVNLELEEPTLVKTFSYAYGENYETKLIGEGERGSLSEGSQSSSSSSSSSSSTTKKTETMPDLTGETKSAIQSYFSSRNISVNFVTVTEGDSQYNSTVATGLAVGQSIATGSSLEGITSITVYINERPVTPDPEPEKCDSTQECCDGDTYDTNPTHCPNPNPDPDPTNP